MCYNPVATDNYLISNFSVGGHFFIPASFVLPVRFD